MGFIAITAPFLVVLQRYIQKLKFHDAAASRFLNSCYTAVFAMVTITA
tara:strand:- start:18066 stop:18209 length:144 start_codon:yes stop_codon:yes gene_type:complete